MSGSLDHGTVRVERRSGAPWLVIAEGDHDVTTNAAFERALAQCGDTDIALDFSGATFVDSSVVGLLLRHAGAGRGRVAVVSPRDTPPRRVFDLIALDRTLPVFDSLQAAERAPADSWIATSAESET